MSPETARSVLITDASVKTSVTGRKGRQEQREREKNGVMAIMKPAADLAVAVFLIGKNTLYLFLFYSI